MGQILTVSDVMKCPHGGTVTLSSTQARVSAGALILRPTDVFAIVGCGFSTGGGPHPCVRVEWQNPARRCKAASVAALTTSSVGTCKAADQAIQGSVLIQKTQRKATAQ